MIDKEKYIRKSEKKQNSFKKIDINNDNALDNVLQSIDLIKQS